MYVHMCMYLCLCVHYSFRRRDSDTIKKPRSNAAFIIPSVPFHIPTYAPLSGYFCFLLSY